MLNVLVWHEYTQDVCTLHHCFCIIDHAIAPSHAPDSILRCFEQFINIMHFYLVESLLHFCPNSVIHWVQIWTVGRPSHRCGEMKAGVFRSRRLVDWWAGRAGTLTWKCIAIRPKGKKVWTLAIAPLTWVRLVTSSALQSRKWQLIGMSQWCRSAIHCPR